MISRRSANILGLMAVPVALALVFALEKWGISGVALVLGSVGIVIGPLWFANSLRPRVDTHAKTGERTTVARRTPKVERRTVSATTALLTVLALATSSFAAATQ